MSDQLAFPPERDLPAGQFQQRKRHLLREIAPRSRPSRSARRAVVLVVLAGVAGGAYAATRNGDPLTFDAISCYRDANVNAEPAAFAPANGNSPIAQCAALWRQGKVGPTRTPPPMVACYRAGEVTVIPETTTATCPRLGLVPLPTNYAAQVSDERSFEAALAARLVGCPSASAARRAAQEELSSHGRSSWRVVVSPPDRYSGPCTNTFAVDQSNGHPNGILVLGQTIRQRLPPTPSQEQTRVCAGRGIGTRRLLDNIDCQLLQTAPAAACISVQSAVQVSQRELSTAKLNWRVTIDHYTSAHRCFAGLAVVDTPLPPTQGVLTILTKARPSPHAARPRSQSRP